jgi:hypothetical protein
LIKEKEEAAVKIHRSASGASRRSERLSKMAAVAYEDEDTQEQFPHGDCYASDYHPNSESESDFDEQIVSLASSPVPTARGRQAALQSIPSSQVGPFGVRAGIRPGTPRPSKQVRSELHVMPLMVALWYFMSKHVVHLSTLCAQRLA